MDGQKNEGAKKRSSKSIDIVSCLESECKWCQMWVCSPFQVIRHNLKVYKPA